MTLIDVHTHVVPKVFPDNPAPDTERRWPCMHCSGADQAQIRIENKNFRDLDSRSWDIDRRLHDMAIAGVTRQVLSPMPELLSYWFAPSVGLEMCRWMNATIANMVAASPKSFDGLGIVPLQDPSLAARELARLREEGFAGVEVGSNINGLLLSDPCFDEFFAEAESLGMAIFVHALHPVGRERLADLPDLIPFGAFPLDTALTAIAMIRSGLLVRYPGLRLGFSHGGGGLLPLVHRLHKGWQMSEGFGGMLPEPPQAYAQRFFYDNLVYDTGYLNYLATEFAPGQIFCGTDYPYSIMEADPASVMESLPSTLSTSMRSGAALEFLGR